MNQQTKENDVPDAAWTIEPIYKPILAATDVLKGAGFSDEQIIDGLLSVSLTWAEHRCGSRAVSQTLCALAARFGADADSVERVMAERVNAAVH
jgi:hypothetical protein